MFSGGWRYILGAICLAVVAGSGQAQERQKEPERPTNEKEAAPDQLSMPLSVVVIETEEAAVSRQRAVQESRDREERDVLAQEGMNSAARWSAKYALVQTILIAIGTLALIWTLLATREVTRVTRDIGEKQVRAYLNVEKSSFSITKNGSVWAFIVVKNYGQSPAVITEVTARLWPNTFEYMGQEASVPHVDLTPKLSIAVNAEQSFAFFWNVEDFPEKSKDIFLNHHDIATITVDGSIQWKDVFLAVDTVTFRATSLNAIEYFKGDQSHKRSGELNPTAKPLGI